MAFQDVPDAALVEVIGFIGGGVVENTFYFTQGGAWALEELQELADAVDDVWAEQMPGLTSSNYQYFQTKATDLREEFALQAIQDEGAFTGTATGSGEAANVAFCIKRLSGLTGRSARGRIYLPGLSTGMFVSVNHVSTTYANALVTTMNGITEAALLVGWTPVIVSRYTGGVKRTHGVTFPITSWSYTDTRVDTQRGRLTTT
jgi:hypothetical protein